ncbi:hypothetical protein LY78DRAFT_726529 [Colletotrichum sublineola]|nr:hypothetical protein LY78DRAFT_726529 [Colletotrichum sublineola]
MTGYNIREDRRKGWKQPWPLAFVMINRARASTSTASDDIFEVLADWIEASPLAKDYAQQLWEAGGFFIPSMCRRLVQAGAFIHCQMWRDRRTAVQIAAAFREHDLIQTLLELGADPYSCSPNGYTALHWLFCLDEFIDEGEPSEINSRRKLREFKMGHPRYQKSRIAASIKSLPGTTPNS